VTLQRPGGPGPPGDGAARFEYGALNVVVPKLAEAKSQTRHIAIDKG
jgi:hypothetical protein